MKKAPKDIEVRLKNAQKYTKFMIVIDVFAIICFFLAYGPLSFFKDMIVTNALTSMSHHYFAYVLYNEDMVNKIAKQNVIIESGDATDTSAIKITEVKDSGNYESVYEEQILKKDDGNDLYKIIELKESKWTGYIVVIYDPSRIDLAIAKNLSSGGQKTSQIAKTNNAIIAINGGGFKRNGSILRPKGNYIQNGKIMYSSNKKGKLIGFNKDNVLVLLNTTAKDAISKGVRDAVEFGPFLIVNGKAAEFKGNGGYGNRPRTAIGQRQDGIVLMIVINGKQGANGVTMKELTNLFVRYKAYNAANLDGGGSSALVVNKKLMNRPAGWNYTGERYLSNAWIVK